MEKRITSRCYDSITYDIGGNIDQVVDYLRKKESFLKENCNALEVFLSVEYDGDGGKYIELCYKRYETDEECDARVNAEKIAKERQEAVEIVRMRELMKKYKDRLGEI